MPGIGPPPKSPDALVDAHRAKTRDNVLKFVPLEKASQPDLPAGGFPTGRKDDPTAPWPAITRKWWKMWGESPLMADATETDWSELMDAAIVHARHWTGDPKAAAELRLRTAKFGATPEDRARLRIQLVAAKKAEASPPTPAGGAKASGRKLVG